MTLKHCHVQPVFRVVEILISPQLRAEINVDWNRVAPIALYYRDTAVEADAVSNQIRAFYFGSSNIELVTRKNLSNVLADRLYFYANRNSALLHAKINQGKPVYLYYFTHRNIHSRLNELGVGEKLGMFLIFFYSAMVSLKTITLSPSRNPEFLVNVTEATQGDELQYLFNMKEFPEIKSSDPHGNFSVKFVKLWVDFASTG